MTSPQTLLVASAGGHLDELRALLPRLGVTGPRTWLTYPTPQAEQALAGERVLHGHHPTTKNLPNALRNYRLARRVLDPATTRRVISTGAAVAVPIMLRARQLGIDCHYVESATRADGPSLSGRLLQRLGGIHLYRQLGDWGEPRWHRGPSVFDGYRTVPGAPTAGPMRMVLSLGSHQFAFASLVDRLAGLVREADQADILWQLGTTPPPAGLPGRVAELLPRDELATAVAEADVVVGHAGVGLSLLALAAGKVPVLVPRRRSRHEHTDDHQVQLARELDRRGLAVAAEVGELSREHLERAASRIVTYEDPGPFPLVGAP